MWRRGRGGVRIEMPDLTLTADEIDYNEESGEAEARGNVHYISHARQEELWASRVEYNFNTERGKFYEVRGVSAVKVDYRPGVLATNNPFYFEGKWADKLGARYILHQGTITNCKIPRPWWTLRGPTFDIIPNQRAIARNSVFRVRAVPIFYTPYFYKALERMPRKSGFLTPNLGNSSRRGTMFGAGYYWAINRSYDATYRAQYFTQRGFAHHVDVRGKPNQKSDFNAIFYGVADRGLLIGDQRYKQGGYSIYGEGRTELGRGWHGRGTLNYLNSYLFRQAFTENFQESIFSESHSHGFIGKQWSSYSFNVGFARLENFQTTEPGDSILIRKLPELSFIARDRRITLPHTPPVWFSLESTAGLLSRSQPLFQTRQYLERLDFQPRVTTAVRWKSIHLIPYIALRATHWGEQKSDDGEQVTVTGSNVNRFSREFGADLVLPSFERTFNRKTWAGDKIKHVIEPRASFRHVAGVADFDRFIRFDETELLTNTTEAEISLTNRFLTKRNGQVHEVLSWTLWQRRYFDPDLGGAIVEGRRNQVMSAVDLTAIAFFDRPRNYSPVVSALRATPVPGYSIEWRSDYDPLRSKFVNTSFTADARLGDYFLSAGHVAVRSSPVLAPNSNQIRGAVGFGNGNGRGWNGAFATFYDYKRAILINITTQVTYNTDCCGISFQYRRFGYGSQGNQYRVAFAVANIGSFGTLKKQDRLF